MKHHIVPFLLLFFSFIGYSCKKSANSNPFGNQKLATVDMLHAGAIEHYRIIYDANNNVDSMIITGGGTDTGNNGFLAFSYVGSSYIITDQNNYSYMVDANTNGMILKVLVADTLSLLYNGDQLGEMDLLEPSLAYPFYTKIATYYTWVNGDVTDFRTGSLTETYNYDNSKSGQPGDGIRVGEFLAYGRSYIKTGRLPVGVTTGTINTAAYFYSFDGKGRVSTLISVTYDNTASSNDTVSYSYSYY